MSKNLLIGLGFFIAVIVVGFYLIGKPVSKKTAQTTSGPVKEINVSAKEFAYTPSTITVNKGDNVKITFTNDGTTAHNLTIPEFNVVSQNLEPGQSDTISFNAGATGSFPFFCSIDSHRSLGLEGTLEVK